jgi:elongation factor Ts
MATIEQIKQLREETSVGVSDAKKALEASDNDFDKAKDWLRKKGISKAAEKSSREAHEGYIGSYIHQTGKLGVIVGINCETDFVARTEDFQAFAHGIAMHIAAFSPLYVSRDDIDPKELKKVSDEFLEEVKAKPKNIQEQILKGKLEKYYSEVCLLDQPFVKDDTVTVGGLLGEMVGKLGENIKIGKFAKIQIS